MNDLVIKEKINIENMIYEIRGKQVIMDRDIALLYKTETRIINQIVKRNIKRFPNDFYFQLTQEEFEFWKSQIVISNQDKKGLRKYPYAFTEQGVAMLSALLKTDIAIQTSIQIIDTFVKLRKYISNSLIEQRYINNMVIEDNKRINLLEESFSKLEKKK